MRAMTLVDFLNGALALSYIIAGVFFLRFWRQTRDRLFFAFAIATPRLPLPADLHAAWAAAPLGWRFAVAHPRCRRWRHPALTRE